MICCPLTSNDESASFSSTSTVKARKPHVCCECGETIAAGHQYERCAGKWDSEIETFVTCLSCVEIRDHFACDGWIFTRLWDDLQENFFPTMTAGGPCMEGLSPEAKARLFDRCLQWRMR